MILQRMLPGVIPERRPPIPLNQAFPGTRFRVIFCDPPWGYDNWTDKKNGAAAAHYPCEHLNDLRKITIQDIAADDCILLLWVTGPKLDEAMALLEGWDFKYTTVEFVWIKLSHNKTAGGFKPVYNPGWHSVSCCEFVVLGKRGSGRAKPREPQLVETEEPAEVFMSYRLPRSHSVKPDDVYERVARMYPGPYLELFARRPRKGWSVWGDEVGPWPEEKQGNSVRRETGVVGS